jgi:hypothetical protein
LPRKPGARGDVAATGDVSWRLVGGEGELHDAGCSGRPGGVGERIDRRSGVDDVVENEHRLAGEVVGDREAPLTQPPLLSLGDALE